MPDEQTTPTMQVDKIKVGARFRRDLGDIGGLARDIDEIGLLHPVVVSSAGELIAGARRLAAWRKSSHRNEPIPVHVVDMQLLMRGEWSENVARKEFTPSEAVAIKRAIEEKLKPAAAARQKSGKKVEGAPVKSGRSRRLVHRQGTAHY